MELNLHKQPVTASEVIFDSVVEQPIECEIHLPDYFPEVNKVVKCAVVPSITSRSVNQDRLSLDGFAMIELYYLSEEKSVKRFDMKMPFTKHLDIKSITPNAIIDAKIYPDFINCRAVNQRKLEVRSAMAITVKVVNQKEENIITGSGDNAVMLKKASKVITKLVCQTTKSFTVRETLELSTSKGAVCCILKSNMCAQLSDYKVLAGKIVAKGELTVKILYKSADESIDTMEYVLPISQIIDADGVDDECECDICLNVCNSQLEPADINDPDCRSIKAEANICCFVKCYKKVSVNMISDCYSTKCECKHESKSINLMKLVDMVDFTEMVKNRIETPENTREIKDMWCEVMGQRVNVSGNNAVVASKIAICMFAINENSEISYHENLIETNHNIPLSQECEAIVFTPDICVKSISYTLASDRLEVRFEVSIKGSLCNMYKMPAITDVAIDETKRKPRNANKLYICYANAGDNVWDIAKHYNTSSEAVIEENMLDNELLDKKTILLIPIV